MAGITEELRLDIAGFVANLQSAVQQAQRAISSIGANDAGGQLFKGAPAAAQRMAAATAQATQAAHAHTQALARNGAMAGQAAARASGFAHTLKRSGQAVAGVVAITAALVALNRKFPQIGQTASKTWRLMSSGAKNAASAAGTTSFALAKHIPRLARVALGVMAVVKAYRALTGAAGGAALKMAQAQAPKAGGGAGKGMFGGGLMKGAGMVALGGVAAAGIVKGISAAKSMISSTMGNVLAAAADEESLQVRMDVLVGDPGKAKQLMDDLKDKAANTPLQFGDLAGAATKLLAFGEASEQVGATLGRVGDISSGVGAPIGEIAEIYGKARVQGTLFAEDINQLTGRGIPVIQEFAKQLGVSEGEVKKMASEGKVTFGNLETAFKSLTGEGGRFEDMMGKMSGTSTGKMSTLRDVILEAYRAIGAPINDAIKPMLDMAIEAVRKLKDRAADIGSNIADGIKQIVAAVMMLAKMDMASIAALLGAALRLRIKGEINFLYAGLRAAFTAGGSLLQSNIKSAIQMLAAVTTGDFWKGAGTALLGVAQLFTAAILAGLSRVVAAIKESFPGASKVLGNSDKTLSEKAGAFQKSGTANLSKGGSQIAPIFIEATKRNMAALVQAGGVFADTFKNTGNIINTDGEKAQFRELADKVRESMTTAIKATRKPTVAGVTEGGNNAAIQGPYTQAGALAGAVNTLTGKSAGTILQEQGNALLKKIESNTSQKPPAPVPHRSRAARAVGVFT